MKNNFLLSHNETLNIQEALGKADGVIAFPTDTVYGLGCLIDNQAAVEKIYQLKNRTLEKPLILLGHSIEILSKYVKYIPEVLNYTLKTHWPGAITAVLPRSRYVPDYINSNLDTIGIRIPDHPILLEILKRCTNDGVLATTSANISGQQEITSFEEVKKLLGNNLDYLVEEYNIPLSGTASTVITLNKDNTIKILRQGPVMID